MARGKDSINVRIVRDARDEPFGLAPHGAFGGLDTAGQTAFAPAHIQPA
ncbi:MAG TPA: hypothetical protein VF060_18820 [Trebonia sp.]